MRKQIGSIVVAVVVVAAVVGALGAVKASQVVSMIEAGEAYEAPAIAVTSATARRESWEATVSAIGTVVAEHAVTLASELPGTIRSVRFESGDLVTRGQLLVQLDTSTERAQLASARADASLAALTLQRATNLLQSGATTRADVEVAEARKARSTPTSLRSRPPSRRRPFAHPSAVASGFGTWTPARC